MPWWRDDYLRYLHSEAGVPYGAPVQQGDVIGRVGKKDRHSTGPHLHLEHRTPKGAVKPDMSKYPVKPLDRPTLTSSFDMNRMHPILGYTRPHLGNDYAAAPGTPLKAPVPGTVERDPRMGKLGFQFHPSKTWDIKPRLRPDQPGPTMVADRYLFRPTADPKIVEEIASGNKYERDKLDPRLIAPDAPSPNKDTLAGYFGDVGKAFSTAMDRIKQDPGKFVQGPPAPQMFDPGLATGLPQPQVASTDPRAHRAPPQVPPQAPPVGSPTELVPGNRQALNRANQMPDMEPTDAAYNPGFMKRAGDFMRRVPPSEWAGLQKMGAAMMAANKASRLPVSPWEVLGKGGLAYNQGVAEYLKNRKRSDDLQSAADMRKALKSARNPDGSIDTGKLMSLVATSNPNLLAKHMMSKSLIEYRNALGLSRDAKRAEVAEKLARLRNDLTRERQGSNRGDVARKAAMDAAMRWARANNVEDQGKISEMARFYLEQYKKLGGEKTKKPDPLGLR